MLLDEEFDRSGEQRRIPPVDPHPGLGGVTTARHLPHPGRVTDSRVPHDLAVHQPFGVMHPLRSGDAQFKTLE